MKDPFYIQWHITNLCNLRCRHCYQDDFSRAYDLPWRGLKEISKNILETLEGWDRPACVHLTGGEPLLKPEIFPLLDYLDKSPRVKELGVITNGLPIDRPVIQKLASFPKLRKMKISLDGPNGQINDSIRQEGTFDKVMSVLPLIREIEGIETIFMFTAMKRNYKSLQEYINLCRNSGVDGLILERFIPWGRGRGIQEEVLSRAEWHEVLKKLLELFSPHADERLLRPFQAFQITFSDGDSELLGAPCIIGADGICIMPGGSVFPCRRFPVAVGDLTRDSLNEIWEKSELLNRLRRKEALKGRCRTCGIQECRGCRSLVLALTGDYLEEDPHCSFFDFSPRICP
jgi:radical SAM protein with 4Fe4S-binding SPASM domain